MDSHTVALFLHIALALAWLGGSFGLTVLGTLAARSDDREEISTIAGYAETLAKTVFVPASILLLLIGIIMVRQKWGFGEAWIIFGIAGIVMTFLIGLFILSPILVKLTEMEAGDERAVLATELLRNVRAYLVLLFVILWDMVSKPAWSDWIELLVMVAIIAFGLVFFIRR